MTMTSSELTCPPRYSTARNFDRPTLGPKVAKVGAALGTPFMPWQQHVADIAFEIDPATGRLHYSTIIITVPRQQGKTSLILPVTVHRAIGFGSRQVITYTAQTGVEARDKWQDDWLPVLEASRFKSWFRSRLTNGHEAILWGARGHRSIQNLMATTKKAGHGKVRDVGVIDEAFSQIDGRIEQAMSPSMITRPSAQLWIPSTQGDAESFYFSAKCDLGRRIVEEGDPSSTIAYFEWSAPPEMDRTDPRTWRVAMPALGHTITEQAVRSKRDELADNVPEFDRAYLNIRNINKASSVFPEGSWSATMDRSSQITGKLAFSLAVAPDSAAAAIGVAGYRADGLVHYEVVDYRPGTDWLVDRAAQVTGLRGRTIAVPKAPAPASQFIPALRRAGLTVREIGGSEYATACQALYTSFAEKQARHIDQPSLNAAGEGAFRKPTGDGWVWDPRSTVDICPLIAITVAGWSLDTPPDQRTPSVAGSDPDDLDELVAQMAKEEADELAALTA